MGADSGLSSFLGLMVPMGGKREGADRKVHGVLGLNCGYLEAVEFRFSIFFSSLNCSLCCILYGCVLCGGDANEGVKR